MKLIFFKKNKRGDNPLPEQIMFISLNIIFFGAMLAFIIKSGTGAYTYEEAYSKQIALLIDNAKQNTTIVLNINDGVNIAKKNGKSIDIVKIDKENNEVQVSLDNRGGYKFKFFNDINVNTSIDGGNLTLIIK